ncbi:endosomal transport [Desmophyllum pertusum]|uniref:Endosomal transport n=1 Tax=Desmophyllum pertusum TaxID=174260 RepID=A0A9X0CWQ1_9CNID|nr:endosomal transport [Desmophyllum pertusum]
MFIHPFKNTHELYSGQTSSIFLHTNTPRVEAVPGSKKEMIPLSNGHSSQIVLSQILVTGTAILISKDVLVNNRSTYFYGGTCHVPVSMGICEMSYPGLLHDQKLDPSVCQNVLLRTVLSSRDTYHQQLFTFPTYSKETGSNPDSPDFIFFKYLFVTVLRHAIELLLQRVCLNKLDDSCVNNLLTQSHRTTQGQNSAALNDATSIVSTQASFAAIVTSEPFRTHTEFINQVFIHCLEYFTGSTSFTHLCLILWPCSTPQESPARYRREDCSGAVQKYFWYYKHHWDSELERELYKLVLSIVTDHPQFIPHTVNLLNSVSVITPDSTFPTDLLRSLSERLVSQSVESVLPNLTHHLKLLSLAMRGTDIFPTPTIRSWFKSLRSQRSLAMGTGALETAYSPCAYSVLLHHHSSATVTELGNLLLLFVQHIGTLTLGTVPDFTIVSLPMYPVKRGHHNQYIPSSTSCKTRQHAISQANKGVRKPSVKVSLTDIEVSRAQVTELKESLPTRERMFAYFLPIGRLSPTTPSERQRRYPRLKQSFSPCYGITSRKFNTPVDAQRELVLSP